MRHLLRALALTLLLPAVAHAAAMERVSVSSSEREATGDSGVAGARAAAMSADGRFVAFTSEAADLVAGDRNGRADVFLRDRILGRTVRVSRAGCADPQVSRGGDLVLFTTVSGGRPVLRLWNRSTRRIARIPVARGRRLAGAALAAEGEHVALLTGRRARGGDLEDVELALYDVEARDREVVLALGSGAVTSPPSLSRDGRRLAFATRARLVPSDRNSSADVYVLDTGTRALTRVSVRSSGRGARGSSGDPVIAANGRFVAFSSTSQLVRRDSNKTIDVYVHDLRRDRTTRASVTNAERQLKGASSSPSISSDGRRVAFQLSPDDRVGDADGPIGDVAIRDRLTSRTRIASVGPDNLPGGRSGFPVIAGAGCAVAFASAAPLVDGDTNGRTDVYARGCS